MSPACILTCQLPVTEMGQVLDFPSVHRSPLLLVGMNAPIVIPSVQR